MTLAPKVIIGNPPWVTNSELGAIKARNIPAKSNIKALSGLDAKTGKSNFDIGEFVLLRLLELFAGRRGCFAMLCKNSIIKNIVEALPQRQFRVSNVRALEIDARREFGAAVEASLLVMDIGMPTASSICRVSTLAQPTYVSRTFGWARNKLMSNIDEPHLDLDGTSPLIWRQGLKHDCARVMELDTRNGVLMNGSGEVADIEEQEVYWLLKSSDLRTFEVTQARKKVIVTQRRIGEDTTALRQKAPRLWEYLTRNSVLLDKRKSSIYHNKPRFSIFGVGEYTFKPYKVAISGLYKEPCFSIVSPFDDRPVILDDTCYLLGFDTYLAALFTASILNSFIVKQFLTSIVFSDAKRPYTKEILMRIDLAKAAKHLSLHELQAYWDEHGYLPRVTIHDSDL